MSLKVTGRVREEESGLGIPNLVVKAVDKDLLYDDLLGDTITDSAGKFEIIYEEEDFKEIFERRPDLYIVVKTPDRSKVLYTSEKSVRCEAGVEEHFEIIIPRAMLEGLLLKPRKFNAKMIMRSRPDFKIDANIDPIHFNASAGGSFAATIGPISATISEIPIKLTIPFLKRRRRPQVVAAIGKFKVELDPFGVKVEGASVRLDGVLGAEGITGKIDTKVNCRTEMDVTGYFSGMVGNLGPDFPGEDSNQ